MSKKEDESCLVCFSTSSTKRSDLPNHFCECNYPIHFDCFKKWKNYTGFRLCIICDINEYHYFEAQQRLINDRRRSLCGLILCFVMLVYFYNLLTFKPPTNRLALP